MPYVHTGEAVVTSIKIDIILIVTTRPIDYLNSEVLNIISMYGRV